MEPLDDKKQSRPSWNDRISRWMTYGEAGSASEAVDPGRAEPGAEAGLLSDLHRECLTTIQEVRSGPWYNGSADDVAQQTRICLDKCHAQLSLWGDILYDGSLAAAFRFAPDLRETILANLAKAGSALVKCVRRLSRLRDYTTHEQSILSGANLKILLDRVSYTLKNLDDDCGDAKFLEDADNESSEDESLASEAEESSPSGYESLTWISALTRALELRTRLLMDLLPMIQQVVTSTERGHRPLKSTISKAFEMSQAGQRWYLQVLDKFAKIDDKLAQRLGEANSQRYDDLRKLKSLDFLAEEPDQTKSLFRPLTTIGDSGLGTSIMTPTNEAASITSHSSFVSSVADSALRRVPKTPAAVISGEPFECEICFRTLSSIKSRTQWKVHVFADLKPYLCTFGDCADHLTVFPSRKLWAEHEFNEHRSRMTYICNICSQLTDSEQTLLDHLEARHSVSLAESTEKDATVSAARGMEFLPLENQVCPMCRATGWTTRRKFVKHVGGHMEDVALSALPLEEDSEDGGSSEVTNEDEPIGPLNVNSPLIDPLGLSTTVSDIIFIIHLLAVGPKTIPQLKSEVGLLGRSSIDAATCVRAVARRSIHSKALWELNDSQYRYLDPWAFPYRNEQERQAAIDHATHAFDRLRLSWDNDVWQRLLPLRGRGMNETFQNVGPSNLPKKAKTTDQDEKKASSIHDETTLEGGLAQTGREAELVRWTNGKGYSLRTGLPYIPTAAAKITSSTTVETEEMNNHGSHRDLETGSEILAATLNHAKDRITVGDRDPSAVTTLPLSTLRAAGVDNGRETPLTANKIRDRLQSMENFRNGEVDIDKLCVELSAKTDKNQSEIDPSIPLQAMSSLIGQDGQAEIPVQYPPMSDKEGHGQYPDLKLKRNRRAPPGNAYICPYKYCKHAPFRNVGNFNNHMRKCHAEFRIAKWNQSEFLMPHGDSAQIGTSQRDSPAAAERRRPATSFANISDDPANSNAQRRNVLVDNDVCVSLALKYLEEARDRHKDIKPENFVVHGTNVILTDFGTGGITDTDFDLDKD